MLPGADKCGAARATVRIPPADRSACVQVLAEHENSTATKLQTTPEMRSRSRSGPDLDTTPSAEEDPTWDVP